MTIYEHLPDLLEGTGITILLMLCSLTFGAILALTMTFMITSKKIFLKAPIHLYVFFICGTPLLVQIFLIYYGSAQFDVIRSSFLWAILREPFACAVIALAINSCAYTIVLLKGAIEAVPQDEITACYALGMSSFLTLRRFILPRALRIVLPAYSNEVIMVLKGTSLASTITILDIMGVANKIGAETYETIEWLLIAAVLYLFLNIIIIGLFRMLEKRANVYLRS